MKSVHNSYATSLLHSIYAGAASRVKRLFAEFRSAFLDWQEEAVQLVAEGDSVAGRFRCSGGVALLDQRTYPNGTQASPQHEPNPVRDREPDPRKEHPGQGDKISR